MRHIRILAAFFTASLQEELAYRANFAISLLNSLLALAGGVLGIVVVFGQIETIRGWTLPATLALLAVYLLLDALRALCFGPSLNRLGGLGGDLWTGRFDFVLLRPLSPQFTVSCQVWRPLAALDLLVAFAVLGVALRQLSGQMRVGQALAFVAALLVSVTLLYSLLLLLTSLTFWSNGFLFNWLFNGLFQLARYPVGFYPAWLRLALTWVLPVGLMTTLPAGRLTNTTVNVPLLPAALIAVGLFAGASWLFRRGLRRYESASS